jgi:hypothetical protein
MPEIAKGEAEIPASFTNVILSAIKNGAEMAAKSPRLFLASIVHAMML